MEPMNTKADLLNELRIDRKAPPEPPRRRGLWIAVAVVVLLLVLAAAWALFGRDAGVEVRTAPVVAIAAGGASASVLDATGYVVARRTATVSSKITGRVREVRIEEGQRVDAGDIMATLDPIDADAQRALSASQLAAARSQTGSVQAQLAQAEADATRLASLVDQQLVSRAQYDQAVAAAGQEMDDAIAAFFAPVVEAAEKFGESLLNSDSIDPDFTVVVREGVKGVEGVAEQVITLTEDTFILRAIESGNTSRLRWINGTLVITKYEG